MFTMLDARGQVTPQNGCYGGSGLRKEVNWELLGTVNSVIGNLKAQGRTVVVLVMHQICGVGVDEWRWMLGKV